MKLLWITDPHLERAEKWKKKGFLRRLSGEEFDAVVITGDISCASRLPDDLMAMAEACASRAVYFVLGNHD